MQPAVELALYDRRSAPPALLSRTLSAWIAVVGPSVTLSQRAALRERGCAVFDRTDVQPEPRTLVLARRGEA